METLYAIEVIKDAHQVDHLLGRVADAVNSEELKGRILELRERWQPLCYDVSACLSGAEPSGYAGSPRKRRGRRRGAAEPGSDGESPARAEEAPCAAEMA